MQGGPILVLGAARSGTKLMRSLVAKASGFAEAPYDVNYLWRMPFPEAPHDALSPTDLDPATTQTLRREIAKAAGAPAHSLDFVEKTVSNILRVPYVRTVFPEARFVVLIRDGRDVAESALRCWRERPSVSYAIAKARTFPWTKCFGYARRAAADAAARALGRAEPPVWGPRYPGIDVDLKHHDLLEVCGRQWLACMEAYGHARHRLPPGRFLEIHYEDLVEAPDDEMRRLAEFVECPRADALIEHARGAVKSGRVGGRHALSHEDQVRLEALLARTLVRWGYPLERSEGSRRLPPNDETKRRAA